VLILVTSYTGGFKYEMFLVNLLMSKCNVQATGNLLTRRLLMSYIYIWSTHS